MSFNEWKEVKLEDVVDTISKRHKFDKDKIILINTSDVLEGKVLNHEYVQNENLKGQFKKSFQKNDILYSEIRPQNKRFAYVDFQSDDYVASTKLMVLRKKNEMITSNFLYQILKSDDLINELQVIAESRSGTFPQITYNELSRMKIKLPPLDEQKAIAHILSTLDDKIEVNNQINKTLENMAQEIFKQWFVDFEFPNEDGESYKSSGGEMVESELGLIPKGWEVASLYDIADYINGTSFKKNEVNEFEGIPIIKIVEIKNGYSKSTSFYNGTTNKAKKYYLRKRDILFSWSGNPETSIDIFIWSKEQGILNQHIFKVEPYDYSKSYIYFLLKNFKSVFMDIASNKQTTGLGHVTVADLKRLKTPIPNEEILSEFIKISDVIIEKIFNNMQEIETLQSLRDSLLPKLLSGEIRVPLDEEGVVS